MNFHHSTNKVLIIEMMQLYNLHTTMGSVIRVVSPIIY